MIKLSDYSEMYLASGETNTGNWISFAPKGFCTKQEILLCFDGEEEFSDASTSLVSFSEPAPACVRVASSNTIFSPRDDVERTLSDYVAARDLLYHWEKRGSGRLASAYVVYFVERNFSLRNLDVINSLLFEAVPSRLTEWSMVALLRASFSARHMLPGWQHFYEAVKKQLHDNERAPRLLAGLDQ